MTRIDWLKENKKEDIAELENECGRPVTDEDIVYLYCPDNHGVPGASGISGCCKCNCFRCWYVEVAE